MELNTPLCSPSIFFTVYTKQILYTVITCSLCFCLLCQCKVLMSAVHLLFYINHKAFRFPFINWINPVRCFSSFSSSWFSYKNTYSTWITAIHVYILILLDSKLPSHNQLINYERTMCYQFLYLATKLYHSFRAFAFATVVNDPISYRYYFFIRWPHCCACACVGVFAFSREPKAIDDINFILMKREFIPVAHSWFINDVQLLFSCSSIHGWMTFTIFSCENRIKFS